MWVRSGSNAVSARGCDGAEVRAGSPLLGFRVSLSATVQFRSCSRRLMRRSEDAPWILFLKGIFDRYVCLVLYDMLLDHRSNTHKLQTLNFKSNSLQIKWDDIRTSPLCGRGAFDYHLSLSLSEGIDFNADRNKIDLNFGEGRDESRSLSAGLLTACSSLFFWRDIWFQCLCTVCYKVVLCYP